MQIWSQIVIKITILGVCCQELSLKKTEYQYKDKRRVFASKFEVVVKSLHDLLFGKVKIILSTDDSRWMTNFEVAGATVSLRDFSESNIDYGEYKLVAASDLYVADYFGRKTSLLGKICLGFEIKPLDAEFEEENSNNIAKKIMSTVFSSDMMESLLNINDIVAMLLEGSPLCNLKNLVGTFLIDPLYNNKIKQCNEHHSDQSGCFKQGCLNGYRLMDREAALKAKRIAQYSAASFLDSTIMNLTMKRQRNIRGISDPNLKAILDRVDVEERNILKYYEGCSDMLGFVLFLEESRMVISFRGTLTKDDIIHDLNTCYVPFLNGYAHAGIKKLSESFFKNEWEGIDNQMKKSNIKKLLITGHSLGAAIGTMLHLMLNDRQYGNVYDIETVVFSSPPTVSRNIANLRTESLTTYNYGNDIVPRISLGALLDFKYVCISLMTDFSIFEDIGSLTNKLDKIRKHLQESGMHTKLYHPGSVIHAKGASKKNCTLYGFKKVSSDFFTDFSSSKDFPYDHMLNRFLAAFDYILEHPEYQEDAVLLN